MSAGRAPAKTNTISAYSCEVVDREISCNSVQVGIDAIEPGAPEAEVAAGNVVKVASCLKAVFGAPDATYTDEPVIALAAALLAFAVFVASDTVLPRYVDIEKIAASAVLLSAYLENAPEFITVIIRAAFVPIAIGVGSAALTPVPLSLTAFAVSGVTSEETEIACPLTASTSDVPLVSAHFRNSLQDGKLAAIAAGVLVSQMPPGPCSLAAE